MQRQAPSLRVIGPWCPLPEYTTYIFSNPCRSAGDTSTSYPLGTSLSIYNLDDSAIGTPGVASIISPVITFHLLRASLVDEKSQKSRLLCQKRHEVASGVAFLEERAPWRVVPNHDT